MNPILAGELIHILEAEVNLGGFHQFFFDAAGDRTAETIEALSVVGALHSLGIIKLAASLFPGGIPPTERFQRQSILDEIEPNVNEFDGLDDAFHDCQEDLSALAKAYGRLPL